MYHLADNPKGAIEPGNFLTTSATPGHAMKATDYGQADSTLIGKAMTPMQAGEGVLELVSLKSKPIPKQTEVTG